MQISELDTPALLVDLDVMERNLARAAGYARQHGLRLRPHTKTHKIPALGRRQLELGAAGLTVAKTTEGEVMLETGTPDLLVAYPVVGRAKLGRLHSLAVRTRVTVALDSVEAARALSELGVEIGVLVEADVGLGRVGVRPEELPALVRQVVALPHLRWEGIAFYPGHIKGTGAEEEAKLETLRAGVAAMVERLRAEGLEPRIVSGGSTPLLFQSHRLEAMNEIRPGTYIFNDRNTWRMGACARGDCAATILTTVVSVQGERLMIDGGSKTFSSDRLATGGEGFGELVEAPEARFHKMNEEHGYIDMSRAPQRFRVGDRAQVLPNHICTAVNLHERIYGVRGEDVVEEWTVAGRGKLQ
jgi:D-serine deaminase-like pyridoxal phosphate-dependent protein